MSKTRINRFGKPVLFRSIERGNNPSNGFSTGSIQNIYNTNITSENSFKYDPFGSAMKSTQQLPVDFSKFENHTFFNSAISKVSIAFNKIINKYPFDGTLYEIEEFEDKMTGYEKYIFDNLDKYSGYITVLGDTYINIKNMSGFNFPEHSSDKSGICTLNPGKKSFTFETFLAVPDEEHTDDMGIFFMSGSNIKIEAKINKSSASETICSASFRMLSGSLSDYSVNTNTFEKGSFNHISFVFDRENNQIKTYVNSILQNDIKNVDFKDMNFVEDLFLLKNGTYEENSNIENYSYFSGSIKDVRVYHRARNENEIKKDYKESIYKNEFLKLNLRMNEPTGSYTANSYVLDSSGNSLHSKIIGSTNTTQFFDGIRSPRPYENPVINENEKRTQILFPDYPSILSDYNNKINLATEYDDINPNLITRMIPPHYFEEILFETGTTNETDVYKNNPTGGSIPGSLDSIKTNILNVILFSWANIFDEIKMFIDSFGNLIFSDYTDEDIVPDQMILFAAKHLGVDLPPIFTNNFSDSFFEDKKVYSTFKDNKIPLKKIQSLIWKRILADASYYKRTKGTIESLKTIFRSSGIDPDKMFAFIEKGANSAYLSDENIETKFIDIPMINFSGSKSDTSAGTISNIGFNSLSPSFISRKIELENNEHVTSGSWTIEGYYCFPKNEASGSLQSLFRLARINDSQLSVSQNKIGGILNIIAQKETVKTLTDSSDTVTAYFTDDYNPDVIRSITINDSNIFDGDIWYVSFSKLYENDPRNEEILSGSTYTLRCYKSGMDNKKLKSSIVLTGSNMSIQNEDIGFGTLFEPQILIGSQSLGFGLKSGIYSINSNNEAYDQINETNFSGKVESIRFWSQFLTEKESKNHSNNIKNYGTENPNISSIFLTNVHDRLRLNISSNQKNTIPVDGSIILEDLTQQEKNLTNEEKTVLVGFENNKTICSYEKFQMMLSPNKIDEINTDNKIRIRSLDKDPDFSLGYQSYSPVYDTIDNNESYEDARFSIEMSIARIINEKINNEIASVGFFENSIGFLNQDFSNSYSSLDYYSDKFFMNMIGDIKIDNLLNVYTWLESSFEEIMKKSLPKKTKFLGMNFVVEPHNLERSKVRLYNENAYLYGETNNEKREEESKLQIFNGDIELF